jgi:hypothetical protein
MAVYSKLLCEYRVTAGVNDTFKVDDSPTSGPYVITLTAGRYRDMVALAAEIQTQINASAATFTCAVAVDNATGIITIDGSAAWTIDWATTTYGTTLRNDLGFTGSETVTATVLTATSQHVGGFYPAEPIEGDDRPLSTGTDRWSSDTQQQEGKTGLLATKGGTVRIYRRGFSFLLSSSDIEAFSTWLARCAQGYSFAFYHDRTVAWSGSSSEYDEYKLLAEGDAGISYDPEPVDPSNTIWHRGRVLARQYVAPTA